VFWIKKDSVTDWETQVYCRVKLPRINSETPCPFGIGTTHRHHDLATREMSAELCSVCNGIFDGPLVVSEERPHHQRIEDFLEASSTCYICRTITKSPMWEEMERRARLNKDMPPAVWFLAPHSFDDSSEERSMVWYKLTIDHDWGGRDEELYPPSEDSSEELPDFYPHTPVWQFGIYHSQGIDKPFDVLLQV
jgi:hypothetical protein